MDLAFRAERDIARAAKRAGFEPERFSGHSLRAGLATVAAKGLGST